MIRLFLFDHLHCLYYTATMTHHEDMFFETLRKYEVDMNTKGWVCPACILFVGLETANTINLVAARLLSRPRT